MPSNGATLAVVALLVLAGCSGGGGDAGGSSFDAQSAASESVGLAVGGAQDANAFRTNVREGYVPQPTDVTHQGLFHDYYFDTGQSQPCEEVFCPSYSRAVSRDPLSNETERYLSVGLNSGVSQSDFEREKLNLVVVVDTSGSMDSQFRKYHYDDPTGNGTASAATTETPETTTKMDAARSALKTMTGKLDDDDRLGIVEYDDEAQVVQELRGMDAVDREELDGRIDDLEAGGGTNLDAGMRTAKLLAEDHANDDGYATRVVYVTDAMPNVGDTNGGSLESRLRDHEQAGIHATFVGVGVDFNTELTEAITSVRGANYYSVHSTERFRDRMDDGFAHMVTPMVYDLSVEVESDDYRIAEVYGSPEADETTGEVMYAKTLFPSRTSENETEGGVVLLQLEQVDESGSEATATDTGIEPVELTASYETTDGEEKSVTRQVAFADREPGYFETAGVRKAVALSRYADLMRNWAAYERTQAAGKDVETPPPGIESRDLGEWEQQSVELRVSSVYQDRIDRFATYLEAEMDALGADRMRDDVLILRKLADYRANTTDGTATGQNTTTGQPA
jgi:Ca-activated chloride channel family protein